MRRIHCAPHCWRVSQTRLPRAGRHTPGAASNEMLPSYCSTLSRDQVGDFAPATEKAHRDEACHKQRQRGWDWSRGNIRVALIIGVNSLNVKPDPECPGQNIT